MNEDANLPGTCSNNCLLQEHQLIFQTFLDSVAFLKIINKQFEMKISFVKFFDCSAHPSVKFLNEKRHLSRSGGE